MRKLAFTLPLAALLAVGCSGNERPTSPDSCQYALDGECDEPEYCAEGTDTTDCGDDSCEYANDGECDEPEYCLYGTDTTDCRVDRLCEPQCGARVCGRDPVCNKSCGTCPQDFTCGAEGVCVDTRCQPQCGNRVCGADPVCGLSCGECEGTFECNADGACIDTSCQPQCGDRQCGADPVCGESCGTCGAGETCTAEGRCQPPCSFGRVTSDTELVKDVQVVTVSGQVTVNGQQMADDGVIDNQDRGWLIFTDQSTGSAVTAPVGETGPATYSVLLFAGTYDVRFEADRALDQDVLPPSQATVLAEGVSLTASGALNYDLKTVTVSGQVTMNGAQMPDDGVIDNQDRGYIIFRDRQSGSTVSTGIGETGPATFSTLLFASTFDIELECDRALDQDVLPPGQLVRLADAMPLTASGALTFDVPVVEVTGEVRVNGQRMADDGVIDNQDRGQVLFHYESTGSVVAAGIGETGPATYRTRLVAGRYRVELESDRALDQDVLPPSARTVLQPQVDLTASGSLGFDVTVITVTGEVTVNGQRMRDDGVIDNQDRGEVIFVDRETNSGTPAPIGETGPATYQTRLFAGTYDVDLLTDRALDQDVLPPAVSTSLQRGLQLTASGSLGFDVSVVTVTGIVTLNGAQMPDDGVIDNQDRAVMLFSDTTTGQTVSVGLGETGPAVYSALLFASRYEVRLQADRALDQDVLPPDQTTRLSAGQDLNASGSLNYDVRTHRLYGQITVNGQRMRDDGVLDNQDRAWLTLVDKDTNSSATVPLGETGPAVFDTRVFEGSYDVYLEADRALDQDVLPPSQRIQLEVGCP